MGKIPLQTVNTNSCNNIYPRHMVFCRYIIIIPCIKVTTRMMIITITTIIIMEIKH